MNHHDVRIVAILAGATVAVVTGQLIAERDNFITAPFTSAWSYVQELSGAVAPATQAGEIGRAMEELPAPPETAEEEDFREMYERASKLSNTELCEFLMKKDPEFIEDDEFCQPYLKQGADR